MESPIKIKSAIISVYHKDNKIEAIIRKLSSLNVALYSTGGTYDFIKKLGIKATSVESLTSYPSILGGRVKTLHPIIFGGILARRNDSEDLSHLKKYEIPEIDLVIVDLYPFEQTVATTYDEKEIIEKIDIGGISLIRAAAKNYEDVLVIASSHYYDELLTLLENHKGSTSIDDRKYFALQAFNTTSHYDTEIFNYFNRNTDNSRNLSPTVFKQSIVNSTTLRYGENPHQKGVFYGDLKKCFEQLNGKELSYNNLVDIDSAINIINDFSEPAFVIIKHTNACGVAVRENLIEAWKAALAGDPVSAYGGIIITNREIDDDTANEINKLFFEIIIAPGYKKNAIDLLKGKKNRIILQSFNNKLSGLQFKSILNGVIEQDKDLKTETFSDINVITTKTPTEKEKDDLLFGNIIVKHNKSNAIVLVKDNQLIGIGTGQTSRVDAVEQAIAKAKRFGFDLQGAVLASDAFFPFADCAEIAHKAGITAIIQPGGSIRDKDTIDYCNNNSIALIFTGFRHFKH